MENQDNSQLPFETPISIIDPKTESIDLISDVWSAAQSAAEDLLSDDLFTREEGLTRLVAIDAVRISPLIGYMLVTRLTEPNTALRVKIVRALGDALASNLDVHPSSRHWVSMIRQHLAQMRTRQVYSLLQVVEHDNSTTTHIDGLLNLCPYAANHLAEIAVDRKTPIPMREQAIEAIGRVGFLDSIPVLEKLALRLESRQNGQKTKPFTLPPGCKETDLLPAIKKALDCLHAP